MRCTLTSALIAAVMLAAFPGCASQQARVAGPYTGGEATATVQRDVAGSLEKTAAACAVLTSDPAQAEALLRVALDLDLYNGVAHNNLGVLFLHAGKLYESAQEFEWARKLLPGHPDPRLNLAIAMQRADKPNEALEAARSALEVQPGHLAAMQAIAIIQVQAGLVDEKTTGLLASIVERCPEAEWRDWATEAKLRIEAKQAAQ
jgi:tetratricopeptide (TPR) repeat protein